MPFDLNDPVIAGLMSNSAEFKETFEEFRHQRKIVEKLEKRPYLTPEEEVEMAGLKKSKLALKDKLEHIINETKGK